MSRLAVCLLVASSITAVRAGEPKYDPSTTPEGSRPRTADLVVRDEDRDRAIPVLVYLPPGEGPAPVVLFSHGLGGARTGSAFLGRHWAARGYVAVFLQHPGSDESVWRDAPVRERMAAMQRAVGPEPAAAGA